MDQTVTYNNEKGKNKGKTKVKSTKMYGLKNENVCESWRV